MSRTNSRAGRVKTQSIAPTPVPYCIPGNDLLEHREEEMTGNNRKK